MQRPIQKTQACAADETPTAHFYLLTIMHGRPSFNLLQNYRQGKTDLYYYVFDLLAYHHKSLLGLPLRDRRALLRDYVLSGVADAIRFSETIQASVDDLIRAAREQGLEGIIAKRATSVYKPGKRSGAWAKYKVNKGTNS